MTKWDFTRIKTLIRQRAAKEDRDITYNDIAVETGLSWPTVERYINNRVVRPDLMTVKALADYFGVDMTYFMIEDATQNLKQSGAPVMTR